MSAAPTVPATVSALPEGVMDPERLAMLNRTGLLDSEFEEAFDRLTRLASRVLRVPVALVSLVDHDRQFFKSQVGLPEPWKSRRETPLTHSFCQHVVNLRQPLIVDNASEYPLVRDNLAVSELGVVAYAGIPISLANGHTLGAFCAIDVRPREWTPDEIDILKDLTAAAVTEIELRLKVRDAQANAEAADRERRDKEALLDATSDGVYSLDRTGRCTFINAAAARMLRYVPEEILGHDFHKLVRHSRPDGSPFAAGECPILGACSSAKVRKGEDEVFWRRDGTAMSVEYVASPILDQGSCRGTLITFRDITKRKQEDRRLAIEHAVSEVLARSPTFGEAAPELLRSIGEALDWKLGCVWVVDSGSESLQSAAIWSAADVEPSDYTAATLDRRFSKGEGLPGKVWATGEPLWSAEIADEPDFHRAGVVTAQGLRSALFIPILAGRDVLGVVEFFGRWMTPLTRSVIRSVKAAGRQIGDFLRQSRAREELRASEALKGAVLSTAMDCIIVIDADGRVVEWNPAAERTFGYRAPRQSAGRWINSSCHPRSATNTGRAWTDTSPPAKDRSSGSGSS